MSASSTTLKLSAVIITLNEEINIGRCIRSLLPVADEVVVVDSGSTDQTVALATALGARVIVHPFEGHIQQKNIALKHAAHPLILSLDADESLSPTLAESIAGVKHHPTADAYTMNRLTNYCGQWIRHSGWYPDRKLRLIRKGQASWGGVNPHDALLSVPGATIAHLSGDLHHYSYYTVSQHITQSVNYATIMARALISQGEKPSVLKVLFSPAVKFLRNYIVRGGFRDGYYGFVICRITAQATFWKYMLMRELHKKNVRDNQSIPSHKP